MLVDPALQHAVLDSLWPCENVGGGRGYILQPPRIPRDGDGHADCLIATMPSMSSTISSRWGASCYCVLSCSTHDSLARA
ncbi:hypothetical protein U9M48_042459 [Paspalum notatum var. saurae]|uniref:Uncharacterized protein n=1 Tax=Paspalum notatum var. saurae TaxID=547442 RepID=A0AAQ3UUV1_PASNO